MLRVNRNHRRYHDIDDDAIINWDKPLDEIVSEILHYISRKDVVNSKNHLLSYLNCFSKYCLKLLDARKSTKVENGPKTFSDNEILSCLRITLFHDAAEVRAACLRAIRYYVQSKGALCCLLELNLQHLIARSLDIVLENRVERVQALRLVRHMLSIEPSLFPLALGRCLCSIANDNTLEKDMLLRACWATIAELTTVNALVSARSGCANVVINCAMSSAIGSSNNVNSNSSDPFHGRDNMRERRNNQMISPLTIVTGGIMTSLTIPYTNIATSEAILAAFLHLYNWPETRKLLRPNGSDLFYFISPFTDTYSFLHASNAARDNRNMMKLINGDIADELAQEQHNNHNNKHHNAADHKDAKLPFYQPGHNHKSNQYASYEHRTMRYLACKNSILTILRSWPGLFFMCRTAPDKDDVSDFTLRNIRDSSWDYKEIYNLQNEDHMLTLHDSLKFFGWEGRSTPRKVTQLVTGVVKAIKADSNLTSSFFTTTTYDSLNPLESLISIFHLPYPEVHCHLLELVYELFGLKAPDWQESFDDALRCIYFTVMPKRSVKDHRSNLSSSGSDISNSNQQMKNYFPEEWQLYDGFVVKEAEQILPSRSINRLNFIVNYYALMLQAMVEYNLLDALVSVVLESNDPAAVNSATILIAELIYLSGKYLPASTYAHRCQSLPSLVAASLSDCKYRRNRALTAIANLNRIHELKKRGPQPASLFLAQQIYFCRGQSVEAPIKRPRSHSSSHKNSDDGVQLLIKSSMVLRRNSFKEWNWDIIADILRHPGENMRKLEDRDTHRAFIRRLLDFFCPSRRQFSMISKNGSSGSSDHSSPTCSSSMIRSEPIYVENPRLLCVVATYFVDFLLMADQIRVDEFIKEFLLELDSSLKKIATKCPSTDEILIPSRLLSTLSHHYFLLLGRFTHSVIGREWLSKTHIYEHLLDLISLSTNDVYMKLIVSSLDYSENNFSRPLLSKVLTSTPESSRLYATSYFRVLLRVGAPKFNEWAIENLVVQLYDRCPAVALAALDILDEACSEDQSCLEMMISQRPALLHLGDVGVVFLARFASHSIGLNYLIETNMLEKELTRWNRHFCARYVRIVEDSLNECFSCHQRSDYGTYGRRSDKRHFPHPKRISMTAYIAPHLYGQLVQTQKGLQVVREKIVLDDILEVIRSQLDAAILDETIDDISRPNEAAILRLKASLWAIGHLATSEGGVDYILESTKPVLLWITTLAKRSLILSLRGTCFYVICLISSTRKGADSLSQYGWNAIQHSHDEIFPINQQEYDNFYLDGRPRFMSDPEKLNQRKSSILSLPVHSFDVRGDDDSLKDTITGQETSQCSSRSSSSSYLSMLPTGQSKVLIKANAGPPSPRTMNGIRTHSFTMSSSSSTTSVSSIYSNTSSIGCLVSNVNPTTTFLRPRSSSDCVPTLSSTVTNKLADSKLNSKPEYQDSGILEQTVISSDLSTTKLDHKVVHSILPGRSRKISAPCFVLTPDATRETRSDSNDSARTGNTTLYSSETGSRSTSFTEYSTSSGVSNILETSKMDRSVSFSPGIDNNKEFGNGKDILKSDDTKQIKRKAKRYRKSISTIMHPPSGNIQMQMQTDDPYPSSVDAHGYAHLRAIQKQRVQSLSGNMFYSGASSVDQFTFDSEHTAKSPTKLTDETFAKADSAELSSIKQRKISQVSTQDSNGFLPTLNINGSIDIDGSGSTHSSYTKSFKRNVSYMSKASMQSVDSVGTFGIEDLTIEENPREYDDRRKFMCLALPESLSQLFHLDEKSVDNCKQKRVQWTDEVDERQQRINHRQQTNSASHQQSKTNHRIKSSSLSEKPTNNEGLELHSSPRCVACCVPISQPKCSPEKTSNAESTNELKLKETQSADIDVNVFSRSNISKQSSENTIIPKATILQRKEVLRWVASLSASMYAKQAEQGLLSLKQRFPSIFEDFCLYSEVCLQMETCNFRATARRFLHELFADVNLNQLYKIAETILNQKSTFVDKSKLEPINKVIKQSTNQ